MLRESVVVKNTKTPVDKLIYLCRKYVEYQPKKKRVQKEKYYFCLILTRVEISWLRAQTSFNWVPMVTLLYKYYLKSPHNLSFGIFWHDNMIYLWHPVILSDSVTSYIMTEIWVSATVRGVIQLVWIIFVTSIWYFFCSLQFCCSQGRKIKNNQTTSRLSHAII